MSVTGDSELATNGKTDCEELSHVEAMKKVYELQKLMLNDPFLQDLPSDVSLDEVQSKLALEQGRGIHLNLRRFDDDVISIVVLQGATVGDLMKAIEKSITRKCLRSGQTTHISWKKVWKFYWLKSCHHKLMDRRARLSHYGIGNHDEITFVKKLRNEGRGKRNK